jgi:RNA polymerase sigma-70 factor (ECF subfamily)
LAQEQDHTYHLIEGCKKGSRTAQEQLYKAYYRALVSLCLRYTKNEADAVEVLNTGFLKVFNNIARYDSGQASLYTWIRTIVIHSCIDHIKAKEGTLHVFELSAAMEITTPAEALNHINAAELLQLIRELPPATAAVFNLYIIEGFSHKEIAALLSISEGTSKWHVNEGRKKLQHLIHQAAKPT